VVGPQTNHLAWQISTETNAGGPAIGRDGTIYQGTDFGQLLALRPDGTVKWGVAAFSRVSSTPAILLDGRIAFVDEGGTLHVVNADGSASWEYATGTAFPSPSSSPAIGRDGTIYSGIGKIVYAFHPDGSVRWTYQLPGTTTGPVSVRPDGIVYVAAGRLYAITSDGSLLWSTDSLRLGGTPTVGPDRTIYLNSTLPTVYAFNTDGTMKWSYQADTCCAADVPATPALGDEGTIYVGETLAAHGTMLALNPDGTLKWQADFGHAPTSPAVDQIGRAHV